MAYSKTDIKHNTVRGQYTWSYLLSCAKSRSVRDMISGKALSDNYRKPNSGFFCFFSSIPPVGPPISVL